MLFLPHVDGVVIVWLGPRERETGTHAMSSNFCRSGGDIRPGGAIDGPGSIVYKSVARTSQELIVAPVPWRVFSSVLLD